MENLNVENGEELYYVVKNIEEQYSIWPSYKKIPKGWGNDTKQKTDVLFLFDEFDSKNTLKKIVTKKDVDTLIYIKGVIVWNVDRAHYNKSGMKKFIGTEVYKNMTARNVNTVRKLGGMMG